VLSRACTDSTVATEESGTVTLAFSAICKCPGSVSSLPRRLADLICSWSISDLSYWPFNDTRDLLVGPLGTNMTFCQRIKSARRLYALLCFIDSLDLVWLLPIWQPSETRNARDASIPYGCMVSRVMLIGICRPYAGLICGLPENSCAVQYIPISNEVSRRF
jgi:hypothetical protein